MLFISSKNALFSRYSIFLLLLLLLLLLRIRFFSFKVKLKKVIIMTPYVLHKLANTTF